MLVLTRRAGQSIVIGNDVVVTVVDVRNGQVRIGVDAPRDIQVHRDEIYEQIVRENAEAVRNAQSATEILRTHSRRAADAPPTHRG